MPSLPKPPDTFVEFIGRFPELGRAWETARQAERAGPLDDRTRRLVKLAVAVGGRAEGAVHSAARKALAAGATADEIYQVVALASSTIGFPNAVAAFSWVRDVLNGAAGPASPGG
ncbi:MAG: carboxymuconolactone decarboxylase family protein [Gemmataceae bacterium]